MKEFGIGVAFLEIGASRALSFPGLSARPRLAEPILRHGGRKQEGRGAMGGRGAELWLEEMRGRERDKVEREGS